MLDISRDVSVNRTVGSGRNASGQGSNPDTPGRIPLSAISSNKTSRNVPARSSSTIQPKPEDITPAKAQHLDLGPAHMYLSTPATGAGGRLAEADPPTPPVLPQLRKLQRQIQTLKAENDDLRAVKITQVATIDDLRGQLRAKDDEQSRLAEQTHAEAARLREAAAALKEEKWTLLGRVAELEQLRQAAVGEEGPGGLEGNIYACSVRSGAPPPSSRRESEAGMRSIGGYETPGSIYSGRGDFDADTETETSSVVTASARSYVRRRRGASAAGSDLTAASLAEEELDILSGQLAAHHERHGEERRAMAEQLAALEGDLAAARRQRDRADRRSRDLEARLAAQMALVRHHSKAPAPVPAPPPPPIPDLPVLTYAKVGLVWFDTVMSTFKYWGLSEFISQPDETLFAGTDPDREGRRLRAVVLLKRAMDDDILDDVMYLQKQKYISAPAAPSGAMGQQQQPQGFPPEIESPYFLFHTAAVLKRTVPSSLTDFGWLDRIGDADFEGIEGFASLVNILNRRHSQLYGTTADHYDALIPRIQENMSRRFPDLDKSLMDPGSAPKKWWHLALWMSRVVKRKQGRIAGIDEP